MDCNDSSGKKVPSITPVDSSSKESVAGLSVVFQPMSLESSLMLPPPMRNLSLPASAALVTGCLTVKMMPGPCVNTASTLTPRCSPSGAKYLS
ncbi:hypothetical protein Y695_04689 [Hydrogenophaga sp. T4]|nr:hypothetical protein Y695_04689 [Hydrogenophaga sp. T4]